MKRKKSIKAEWGMGLAYIEPVPTFRPPSLGKAPEVKLTKLMKRLLDNEKKKVEEFKNTLSLRLPKPITMVNVTTFYDSTPLNLPPLFSSAAPRKIKRK